MLNTNNFKVTDYIQNLDNAQLQQLMSSPPPGVPVFLIMGEAQRRQQLMQQMSQQPQGPAPTTTVADDLKMGLAGLPQMQQNAVAPDDPQGMMGLGSFAPPQQPQMDQMQGPVQQFNEGDLVEGDEDGLMERLKKLMPSISDPLPAPRKPKVSNRFSVAYGDEEDSKKDSKKDPREEAHQKKMWKDLDKLGLDKVKKRTGDIWEEIKSLGKPYDPSKPLTVSTPWDDTDPHVPAKIPDARLQDLEDMHVEEAFGGKPEDPPAPSVPSTVSGGGIGGSGAGIGSLPDLPGIPKRSVPQIDAEQWKYTHPDMSGIAAPDLPQFGDDEEYIQKVKEMFPSTVYDKHMSRVDERLGDMDRQRGWDANMAMMKAAMEIMGGDSPNGMVNIGKGMSKGFDQYVMGERESRAHQEKLEERREALELAKLEYERGNVETAMRWKDRADKLAVDMYNLQHGRYEDEVEAREKAATRANEETGFKYGMRRDAMADDLNERQLALQKRGQDLSMIRSMTRGGAGGMKGQWTHKDASKEFRTVFAKMQSAVAASIEGVKAVRDPGFIDRRASERTIEHFMKHDPSVLEVLGVGGGGGGGGGTGSGYGAISSAPEGAVIHDIYSNGR